MAEPTADPAAGVAPVAGRRVLVVDDDAHIREVATMALELVGGWQVLSVASGADAAQVAKTEHLDAVLLDVMMPGIDGPSTVAQLREDPSTADIPVILLTAKGLAGEPPDWRALGLAGLIAKPFDPMTLAEEVARLLHWNELPETDHA